MKAKINSRIYDIANWETNSYDTYITYYFRKLKQSDDEIWSIE